MNWDKVIFGPSMLLPAISVGWVGEVMKSVELLLSPGWAISLLLVVATVLWAKNPKHQGCERLFLFSFGMLIATMIIGLTFSIPSSYVLTRYDQYAYCIDKLFGQPSFVIGRILFAHPTLRTIAIFVYCTVAVPLYAVICIYFVENDPKRYWVLMRVFILNVALAPLGYMICPVSGPSFAFDKFPVSLPNIRTPHVMYFSAAANGVPSLHFSAALLVLVFTRRWKGGRVFGPVWLALTFLVTLGLGEHYLVDLIAAVLFVWLILFLVGDSTPCNRAELPNAAPESRTLTPIPPV
jgi:hypothetical protein